MSYVYCDSELCTGCRACELACSGFHERVFNPLKSRIRAVKLEPNIDIALTCRHCADPPCARACPVGAIHRSPSGIVWVDLKRCIGCGQCSEACPFGVIYLSEGKAIKCDLCGGDPECIKQCPVDALKLRTSEQVAEEKRRAFVEKLERPKLKKLGVK